MQLTRTSAAVVAAAGLAGVLGAGTAVAAAGGQLGDQLGNQLGGLQHGVASAKQDTRWHRYHQADVSYKKDDVCTFAVKGHVLRDKEYVRNVNFWPNGKPRTQLFRGPLVFRWTNEATGKAVVRNQSGHAYVEYTEQGGFASLNALDGHFGAGLHPGARPHRGLFYLGGAWTAVSFDAKGRATLSLGPRGTMENLCKTLG